MMVFYVQPEKVSVLPILVSMETLVWAEWSLITTNDVKRYFYNNKTKAIASASGAAKCICLNHGVLTVKKAAQEKASFKAMLQERVDLTVHSRWSRVQFTYNVSSS